MDTAELDRKLATMDWEHICNWLEEQGFRLANPDCEWEFDSKLFEDENVTKALEGYEDVFANRYYSANVYENIKGYEGFTFVKLVLWGIYRDHDGLRIPRRTFLYTTAPVNEEYEKIQASKIKCSKCKEIYMKKELMNYCGKWLCPKCLLAKLLKEGRKIHIDF